MKERGDDPKLKIFSCVLTGNPGTGKTSFAQLYGELLGELRVVPAGRVVRLTGAQLQDGEAQGARRGARDLRPAWRTRRSRWAIRWR